MLRSLAPCLVFPLVLLSGCFTNEVPDDDTGDDGSATPSCEDYCQTIDDLCVGTNKQYDTPVVCESNCASYAVGSIDDDLGNTLGCRMHYALASGENPEADCPHAGPSGGGICGGVCESFCGMQARACTGANQQYANTAECVAECEGFPGHDTPFNTTVSDADTFVCRLKHLLYAVLDPETHCSHIGAVSATCQG